MLRIFRRNRNRKSYEFTKRSARMEDLSKIPNNDLTPFPYKAYIEKPLANIEREFDKKISKSKNMYLDIENRSMFNDELKNAKVRPLSILQEQVGVHQRMINEVIINIMKNSEINQTSLDDKLDQQKKIDEKLDDAMERLAVRDGKGGL